MTRRADDQAAMRLFELHRDEDLHGNSGTGIVAQGVEFDSGYIAFTWLSHLQTVTTATSMRVVDGLHSHEGRTKVVWIDEKVCQELLATMPEEVARASFEELKDRFTDAEKADVPDTASAEDGSADESPDGEGDAGADESGGG